MIKKLLALILLLTIICIPLLAEVVCIKGLYYELNETNRTAQLTYKSNIDYNFNEGWNISRVEIPSTVNYDNVTFNVISIGACAFRNCSYLTNIIIPQNITHIEGSAFVNCTNLSSIIVDNGNIVYDSRNNCNAIIETKSNSLIVGCKNTYIPYGITSIMENAFWLCRNLTSITIPNSVTSIGTYAFCGCQNLTSIEIPNGVTKIEERTFLGCHSLKTISLNNVTTIGKEAFLNCESLISITIPSSVITIGQEAFRNCENLTSITIPNSVTSIGIGAFYGCSSLNSINIPASVTNIGFDAFSHCSSLKSIIIPNSVTIIEWGTFEDCSNLTSITIPNSVTTIGKEAFRNCENLTSITIPSSVTNLGIKAFSECTNLKEIKYPKGLDLSKAGVPASTKLLAFDSHTTINPQPKTAVIPDKQQTMITWLSDQLFMGKYTFEICIKSKSKIESVNIYVNGYLITERGIVTINNDGCDMVVNKTVDVYNGQNIIKIEIVNASGKTISTKNISYIDKKSTPTRQQKCIALVMGNANYIVANKLKNPVNDATDFASKLENLGFTVIRSMDQTHKGMDLAIRDFGDQAKDYDVALFYYAGHGMQYDGINYLIPIDADFHEQRDAKYNCVNMYEILEIMDDANCPMKIVVLDACRNNPFRSWVVRGENSGLCNMTAPTGTFIAFSTAPGKTASDGQGRNSPYTTALLQMLDVPGLSLTDFFQEVLEKVVTETKEQQNPWTSGSFRGKFYFNKK